MTETITTDTQQEIKKNYRFNFVVNSLDGAFFWLGASFIAPAVILPLYVSHFTDNPFLIGLIPFLSSSGYLLPQLFMANIIQRAPRKKIFPVNYGFFLERVPIFLLAPSAYFLALGQPSMALITCLLLYTWYAFGMGVIIVGWQDMIAKIFPVEHRGRFLGITNFVGNGTGILGALAVAFVLDQFPFPMGFVFCFAAAALFSFVSWFFLSLAREPAVPSTRPAVSQMTYLCSLPAIVRKDRNFRMYLFTQIVFSISYMAIGFLAVYTTKTWGLSDAEASGYVIAMQIGLAISNLFFGFLADRKGHKLSLEICLLVSAFSLFLAVIAPSPLWFFPIFFLRGAVNAGTFISGTSIVYEFTDADSRPIYIGLANTLPGIAGTIAPLVGGWMVGAISYQAMFSLSAAVALISWAMLRFTVREPRHLNASGMPSEPVPAGESAPLA